MTSFFVAFTSVVFVGSSVAIDCGNTKRHSFACPLSETSDNSRPFSLSFLVLKASYYTSMSNWVLYHTRLR